MRAKVFSLAVGMTLFCFLTDVRADIIGTTTAAYVRPNNVRRQEDVLRSTKHGSIWDGAQDLFGAGRGFIDLVEGLASFDPLQSAYGANEFQSGIGNWQRSASTYQWAEAHGVLFIDRAADYDTVILTFDISSDNDPLFPIEYVGFPSSPGIMDISTSIPRTTTNNRIMAAYRYVTLHPKRMKTGVYAFGFSAKEDSCYRDCFGIVHSLILVVNCNPVACNQTANAQAWWQQKISELEAQTPYVRSQAQNAHTTCVSLCDSRGGRVELHDACEAQCDRTENSTIQRHQDRINAMRRAMQSNIPPPSFSCCLVGPRIPQPRIPNKPN